nr:MAG TPA: hypothetical protein [Caudoviricetes sp.]
MICAACIYFKTGARRIWTIVRWGSTAMLEIVLSSRSLLRLLGKRLSNSCAGSRSYQLGCDCHQTLIGMKPFRI